MTSKKRQKKSNNGNKFLIADDELTRLRIRLNKKQEYIAILELELFNTRAALYEYQILYNECILPIEENLRRLRRFLYEALNAQQSNGSEEEKPDFSEEDDDEFYYQDKAEQEWRKVGKENKAKDPHTEEKIRKLFHELAKRFHPDLTIDPEEKKYRQEVMTKVNQAYSQRDLKSLQALAEQPDRPAPSSIQSKEDEIDTLKTELFRLDGVIAELKASIHHLEESPAMRLVLEGRVQRRNGKDLLTEMESKLNEQVADLQEHLIVLGVDFESVSEVDQEPAGD